MSLRTLLGFGKKLLSGKKESAVPTTGQQTKQITYTPKPSQAPAKELVTQELKNPPVVLKKTKPLQMGDDIAPAFGSSTYDWVMRKGRGKYTADEWIDHLTSRRKETFNIFGKPASRTVLDTKKFKYDNGPFAGKEVNITKEELFDSNLAIFNEAGDLTGGLLLAAKKFGLKLDANEVGAMVKLNPINRLKTKKFGIPEEAVEKVKKNAVTHQKMIESISNKYKNVNEDVVSELEDASYYLKNLSSTDDLSMNINDSIQRLTRAREKINNMEDKKLINKLIYEMGENIKPVKGANQVKYYNDSQTLMGGQNYRETVFYLDEPIKTNYNPLKTGTHFSNDGDKIVKNEIFHVRFDTRFTPDGKKVLSIHQIQADNAKNVAKNLSRSEQLDGINRLNPFQKDIENRLFMNSQKLLRQNLDDAANTGNASKIFRAADDLNQNTKRITQTSGRGNYDYFPMPDSADYNDHALKYLMQLAAREGADYVSVLPFDMLNYKASSQIAGNERSYGYSSGKGIGKKGKAVIPELMKKAAKFYSTKAGPIKVSRSNPKKPYKRIETDNYTYDTGAMKGKKFTRTSHTDAVENPKKGYKLITEDNPNLYFDAFAVKVVPLMRNTQKTYKSEGGLVVDMFKPIRYN